MSGKTNPTIEVVVHEGGGIEIDAVGFQGSDCEQATGWLERALGLVGVRRRKPEYHRRARTRGRNKQKLGGGENHES